MENFERCATMIYAFMNALLLLQWFFIILLKHMKTVYLDKGFLDETHVKVAREVITMK